MARWPRLNLPALRVRNDGLIAGGLLEQFSRALRTWGQYVDDRLTPSDAQMFTPRLTATTANPNLGADGLRVGWFTRIGDQVHFEFAFKFDGAGIAQGTGTYEISLPVTPRSVSKPVTSAGIPRGFVHIFDDSAGQSKQYYASVATTGRLRMRTLNSAAFASTADITNATVGLTFAADDLLAGQVTYFA